jgi:hypothetical protein
MHYDAVIWTEGKTDSQHLQRAQRALNITYNFSFEPAGAAEMGQDQLLKQCRAMAMVPQPSPTVFVFDRDTPEIVQKVEEAATKYKA